MNILDLRAKKTAERKMPEAEVKTEKSRTESKPTEAEETPRKTAEEAGGIPPPIVWEAEEFEYRRKDGSWFLSAGIIGLALLTFALMTRNFLMAILIFVFAFVVYVFAAKKPRMMEFEISGDGVAIRPLDGENKGGGRFFPFESLTSFWIFRRGNGKNELSFETEKLLYPRLKLILSEDIDLDRLRKTLSRFLEEKEQEESLSDILARFLKF